MVLNNGEWAEIQHDSTVWLKCVPPCVPLLRSIRPVAHLRLTPWELTRQWKWGTGHDWQHQQNVYFWIAQPPAPWELLSSSIFFHNFPHEFPSAEGMSSAQENLEKHLQITWPVERPCSRVPARGSTGRPAKGFGTWMGWNQRLVDNLWWNVL
jgi:hypothetical protein